MNTIMNVLMGLIAGYVIGILVAAVFAFVFGMDDAARFIAIAFGLLGAMSGPSLSARLRDQVR
jgi:hypothetical protein